MADIEQPDLTALTVQLLSAYFANNSVPSNEIAALIETTRAALVGKAEPDAPATPEYVPAVTVRKSLASRDQIISMIDGKAYKTLKRHLAGHGLTPADYRSRYNLPADYPMVAPGYSEHRREVAKRLGLGRKANVGVGADVAASAPEEPTAAVAPAKRRGGRKPGQKETHGATAPSPAASDNSGVAELAPASPKARRGRKASPKQSEKPSETSTPSSTDAASDVKSEPKARRTATGDRSEGQGKTKKRATGSSRKAAGGAKPAKTQRSPAGEGERTPGGAEDSGGAV